MGRVVKGQTSGLARPILLDDTGRLRTVVEVNALPSGAATEAKQDDIITLLQAIEDLRNALYSVGLDTIQVRVNYSVCPDGAATSAKQDTIISKIDSLADLIYLGDNFDCANAQTDVPHDTLTTVVDYTVPTGKTAYIVGVGVSPTDYTDRWDVWIYVGSTCTWVETIRSYPLRVTGICLGKQTEGGHIYIRVRQWSGSTQWINANLIVLLV